MFARVIKSEELPPKIFQVFVCVSLFSMTDIRLKKDTRARDFLSAPFLPRDGMYLLLVTFRLVLFSRRVINAHRARGVLGTK